MRLTPVFTALLLLAPLIAPLMAEETPLDMPQAERIELIGELVAFHGTATIVSVMSTHCYETTGLDRAYRTAAENWHLRNIGYLDLADRVVTRLGGADEGQKQTAQTYAGTQIMSAYNAAPDKNRFCREFLEKLDTGGFDIDKTLAGPLQQAQAIATQ